MSTRDSIAQGGESVFPSEIRADGMVHGRPVGLAGESFSSPGRDRIGERVNSLPVEMGGRNCRYAGPEDWRVRGFRQHRISLHLFVCY